jgi:NAD(P)-dependent dehydrogenase (short-subunit alcohol dehydrogenase family)
MKMKVLVTGSSQGIGKAIAERFLASGHEVIGIDRQAASILHENYTHVTCDVRDRARLPEIDGVNILVNNAGAGVRIAPLAGQSDAEIAAAVNTNLTGAIMGCARAAARMSRRAHGAIVNISSVCALHAWPGWSVYTAAKAGLSKFSHALHTEMRPFGVRVFCLTPSWGATGFNRAAGIEGASEDPALAAKCISPDELGRLVADLLATPDHLAVPDVTVQPMIQAIEPM